MFAQQCKKKQRLSYQLTGIKLLGNRGNHKLRTLKYKKNGKNVNNKDLTKKELESWKES